MNVKDLARSAIGIVQKNSPYILTGLGVAGVVSTAVMTGHATIKAVRVVDEANSIRSEMDQASLKEKFLLTWKLYLPPVIMGATSIACIIGAQSVSTKRNAALAGLYSLTETTLKEYQDKVVEQIGANKEQKIREEVAQEKLDKNPVTKSEVIITGKGDQLCYDVLSGRYFKSDIETLRRIQNDFNHELIGSMWVPLNDLYYVMGLPQIKIGDDIGWTVDQLIEFKFESKLADDGTPCLVLDYNAEPRYRCDSF